MTNLQEIYKAQHSGTAPDLYTKLIADWLSIRKLTGAPPLLFKSNGKPLINWSISGNTVQNATPENPVELLSVGDKIENLFDFDEWADQTGTMRGVSVIDKINKSITITATDNDAYTNFFSYNTLNIEAKPNTTYCLSWKSEPSDTPGKIFIFPNGVTGSHTNSNNDSSKKCVITTPSDTEFITIRFGVANSGDTIKFFDIMLNEGAEPLPYGGYKILIVSSSDNLESIVTIYLNEPLASGDVLKSDGKLTKSDGTTEIITVPEIPTFNGFTTIDVDTEIKPTEIYIRYEEKK